MEGSVTVLRAVRPGLTPHVLEPAPRRPLGREGGRPRMLAVDRRSMHPLFCRSRGTMVSPYEPVKLNGV